MRLAAEQEIAGDVDRVAEGEVLIDHLDPLAPRVGGRSEADFLAVEHDPSGVGMRAPDRILLSVDFPAPLSPTRPRTSPARRTRLTRSSDLIAPNDLLMSSILTRIGAPSVVIARPHLNFD